MKPGPDTRHGLRRAQAAANKCYSRCATPRCGSKLLCEALRLTKRAGRPEEFFLEWATPAVDGEPDTASQLRQALVKGTTANDVFGVKIMWSYFHLVVARLRDIARDATATTHSLLAALFPDLHYIRVVRRDKIRQAVSMAKALQSDQWTDADPNWTYDLTPEQILEFNRWRGTEATLEGIVEYYRANPRPVRAGSPLKTAELRYDYA